METLRPLLITYAYNISGSLEDAKDVVQDAFLQFMQVDGDQIRDKKAYLVRMVINLAINQKNRQQKLRAAYPGEWLPEPVSHESADGAIHKKEVLSYSLMVLLEKLDPRQRAVFILKEAFDYEHTEIAEVLGITAEYSRKILSRSKKQLEAGISVQERSIDPAYLNQYLDIVQHADAKRLEQFLSEDITVVSDGGGKASASLNPIHGKQSVMAMLLGLHQKFYTDAHIEEAVVNHQPALFYFSEAGKLVNCQVFTFENGRITQVFFIRNPDKLQSLQKQD